MAAAVGRIRDQYAPMIEAFDVPTMWETWDRFGFHGTGASQVHSGSSGPAWTLWCCILGVYSEGPGPKSETKDTAARDMRILLQVGLWLGIAWPTLT